MMFPLTTLTVALLEVLADTDQDDDVLDHAWDEYRDSRPGTGRYYMDHAVGFVQLILRLTGETVTVRNNCAYYGVRCDDCDDTCDPDELHGYDGGWYCESCFDDAFTTCDRCSTTIHRDEVVVPGDGGDYCQRCIDYHFHYCDYCDDYFDDEHTHDCDCDAPNTHFHFPANGAGTVAQDERIKVELPKGTIDEEGLATIARMLNRDAGIDWSMARSMVDSVGPEWQGKRGNFTKRLSSAFYKGYSIKLAPEVVSEIGNLARAHSGKGDKWFIEVTRNLNLTAEEFGNEESCWWSNDPQYNESRCAFKHWGGLGLRTYSEETKGSGNRWGAELPEGRAWVQPLNDALEPTHDTIGAHAYMVYNGYGDLDGYAAARIVAHLTGKTYKKLPGSFTARPQYVNNSTGFLIADAETCANTDSVSYNYDIHDNLDAQDFTIA